jgi:hypothetical protein
MEVSMKLKILPVTTAILIAAAPAAFAQGVSGSAPGQQQPKNYQGSPGSSYYAPGQEKKNPSIDNPNPDRPGASGYAPGNATTGAGSNNTHKKSK